MLGVEPRALNTLSTHLLLSLTPASAFWVCSKKHIKVLHPARTSWLRSVCMWWTPNTLLMCRWSRKVISFPVSCCFKRILFENNLTNLLNHSFKNSTCRMYADLHKAVTYPQKSFSYWLSINFSVCVKKSTFSMFSCCFKYTSILDA